MLRESAVFKSLFLVGLFLCSLFAAGLVSQPQPVLIVEEVDSASGGARHLYTFADGSSVFLCGSSVIFPSFLHEVHIFVYVCCFS